MTLKVSLAHTSETMLFWITFSNHTFKCNFLQTSKTCYKIFVHWANILFRNCHGSSLKFSWTLSPPPLFSPRKKLLAIVITKNWNSTIVDYIIPIKYLIGEALPHLYTYMHSICSPIQHYCTNNWQFWTF